MTKKYYLVESSALPDVFHKVIKAKEMLSSGEAKTVSEAVVYTDLSRSAFYKYKDVVFTFNEKSKDRVVSMSFTLQDEPGIVSGILSAVAEWGCNILTLHQGLPSGNVAVFTLSVETHNSLKTNEELIETVTSLKGVIDVKILGSE